MLQLAVVGDLERGDLECGSPLITFLAEYLGVAAESFAPPRMLKDDFAQGGYMLSFEFSVAAKAARDDLIADCVEVGLFHPPPGDDFGFYHAESPPPLLFAKGAVALANLAKDIPAAAAYLKKGPAVSILGVSDFIRTTFVAEIYLEDFLILIMYVWSSEA